jgi:hypothetical protein
MFMCNLKYIFTLVPRLPQNVLASLFGDLVTLNIADVRMHGVCLHDMAVQNMVWLFFSTLRETEHMLRNSPERIAIVCHVGRAPHVVSVLLTHYVVLQLLVELHSPETDCAQVKEHCAQTSMFMSQVTTMWLTKIFPGQYFDTAFSFKCSLVQHVLWPM